MRLKKIAALATAVVLAVSLLAGCGGSGEEEAGSSSTPSTDVSGSTEDGGENTDPNNPTDPTNPDDDSEDTDEPDRVLSLYEQTAGSRQLAKDLETSTEGLFRAITSVDGWQKQMSSIFNSTDLDGDGNKTTEEAAKAAAAKQFMLDERLDLTKVTADPDALVDTIYKSVAGMLKDNRFDLNNEIDITEEILNDLDVKKGESYLVDMVEASEMQDGTYIGSVTLYLMSIILKDETLAQSATPPYTVIYQGGVVPLEVKDNRTGVTTTYYMIAFVARQQQS